MSLGVPQCGSFSVPGGTQSANTKITRIIQPFANHQAAGGGGPKLWTVDNNQPGYNGQAAKGLNAGLPNWTSDRDGLIHVTDVIYTSVTTSHTLYFMRPLGFTWAKTAIVSNTTAFTVAFDPGSYSTAGNFQYPLPSGLVQPALTNNVAGANDFVCWQQLDGTWVVDTISSTSTLTWTMTTGTQNTNANAGIAAFSPIFWFGTGTDVNPRDNQVHPNFLTTPNTNNEKFQSSSAGMALVQGLARGDPMVVYSTNGTNAGQFSVLSGVYSNLF